QRLLLANVLVGAREGGRRRCKRDTWTGCTMRAAHTDLRSLRRCHPPPTMQTSDASGAQRVIWVPPDLVRSARPCSSTRRAFFLLVRDSSTVVFDMSNTRTIY